MNNAINKVLSNLRPLTELWSTIKILLDVVIVVCQQHTMCLQIICAFHGLFCNAWRCLIVVPAKYWCSYSTLFFFCIQNEYYCFYEEHDLFSFWAKIWLIKYLVLCLVTKSKGKNIVNRKALDAQLWAVLTIIQYTIMCILMDFLHVSWYWVCFPSPYTRPCPLLTLPPPPILVLPLYGYIP